MLDDDEFKQVSSLFNTGTEGNSIERMFGPALIEYERLTGIHECHVSSRFVFVWSAVCQPRKAAENS